MYKYLTDWYVHIYTYIYSDLKLQTHAHRASTYIYVYACLAMLTTSIIFQSTAIKVLVQ